MHRLHRLLRLLRLHTTSRSRETCYATIISQVTFLAGIDTHLAGLPMEAIRQRQRVAEERRWARADGFRDYRGECDDAPGWYPTSRLAASASHAPAARLGLARLGSAIPRSWSGRAEPLKWRTYFARMLRLGYGIWRRRGERWMSLFFGFTEERVQRWGCYAGVPSLSALLSPPTLRPSPSQSLSLSPAPTGSVPDCCSGSFFL